MKLKLSPNCAVVLVVLAFFAVSALETDGLAAKPSIGAQFKKPKANDTWRSNPRNHLKPSSQALAISTQDTLYAETFDGGAPGWTFQDLWSEPFWHVSTTGALSGQSYWCGIEELGGYDDIWQQTLTSPAINLSGATAPVLTFMHNFRAEPLSGGYPAGFNGWDAMNVRVSTDGENFTVIAPSAGRSYNTTSAYGFNLRFGAGMAGWAGNSNGWIAASFDLTSYAGQTVWIQFLFGSDEGYSQQDDATLFGWRVDDIKIADGATTIFEDNAGDTGTAQFSAGGPGGPNLWHLTTTAAASAPYSAGCFDPNTGNYLSGMKAGLVSPAISLGNLPADTQELIADFKYRGALDPTTDSGWNDIVSVDVRAHSNGGWGYWSWISGTSFIFNSFLGYGELNNSLGIGAFIGADSVQFRIFVLTRPDGNVVAPANVFIDDFTLGAYQAEPIIGPQFSTFLTRVTAAPEAMRTAIVDSFMATIAAFPFVEEDTIAYYLYRGNATTVTIPGDANGWNVEAFPMARISGTNLWYRQGVFESDARLGYLFFLNGSTAALDPLNPNRLNDNVGTVSELAMPDYVQPPEIIRYSNIPHGTLRNVSISSTILGYPRTIRVYAPPAYTTAVNDSFPVVLFHDGNDYISAGSALNVLDYLISENRIQSIIAVFVPPVRRDDEYAFNLTSQFESFIVDELMPIVDAQYRTKRDPASRAMIGFSFGGLITTQICYNRPQSFGLCAPYSPSYWAKGMEVYNQVVHGPKKDIKFYLDWGTYEPVITINARAMRDELTNLGYELSWNEWHEAHSFGSWRAHIDNALEYFFPANVVNVADNERAPTQFSLHQNYPNPFNPSTTISYTLPNSVHVKLVIYDVLGKVVRELVDEREIAGHHEIAWNGKDEAGINVASGVYIYKIMAGEFEMARKLLLVK